METSINKIDCVKRYFTGKTLKYSGEIFVSFNGGSPIQFNDFTFQIRKVRHKLRKNSLDVLWDDFWFDVLILDGTYENTIRPAKNILDTMNLGLHATHRNLFVTQAVNHVIRNTVMIPYFSYTQEFYVNIRILNVV